MKTPKLTPIQKAISALLKENTGRHFLDSGGAYGRNFERNEKINFLDTPKFYDNTSKYGISVSYNVFWYLTRFLEISPASKALNAKFQKYYKKQTESCYDPEIMETFAEKQQNDAEIETDVNTNITNTYNYENLLSQVLQYCVFENYDGIFIILQIHGGCDVRGGYTDPKIFELKSNTRFQSEAYFEFLTAQTYLTASDGENSWDSYNSGYAFEASGNNNEPDFNDVTVIVNDKLYNKMNGKRITFGNSTHWDGGEGEFIPEIVELREFVQQNYQKSNLTELVKEKFEHFDFDLTPFINEYIKEIESNTLSLDLN